MSTDSPLVSVDQQRDDPIVLFSLVDFLIQLIVLGLFAAVLFALIVESKEQESRKLEEAIPVWVKDPAYLPLLKGMSPMVDAENAKELAKLLQAVHEKGLLEDLVKFLNSAADPLKAIRNCAENPKQCEAILLQCNANRAVCDRLASTDAKRLADILKNSLGRPPCIATPPRHLFKVVARDGDGEVGRHYEVLQITAEGQSWLKRLGVPLVVGQHFAPGEVSRLFKGFDPAILQCAHFVQYVREADSERMRAALEPWFYLEMRNSR
jgi:hypothetical protein